MLNTDQILATQRAHVDTLIAIGGTTLDGVEQLTRLNLATLKGSLEDASELTMALLSTDPAKLGDVQTGWLQPAMTRASGWHQQAQGIAVSTGTAVGKQIEAAMTVVQRDLQEAFKPMAV